MAKSEYFGKYARFDTASKKEGASLVSANNLVGDVYSIEFDFDEDYRVAWMKSRFGERVGFFDDAISKELSLCEALGWKLQALLSFVAYDDVDGGQYWGEAALICYDPRHEDSFAKFTASTSKRLADGIRPQVDLGAQGVQQVVESLGSWTPKKTVPLPAKSPGTAMVKTRRSPTEKLVEQGRANNKGCYVGTILVFAAIIAAIVFGLRSFGVF